MREGEELRPLFGVDVPRMRLRCEAKSRREAFYL